MRAWIKPLPVFLVLVVVLLLIPLFVNDHGTAIVCIILGSVLGVWASLALHELGHLVAGKWVDFRFAVLIAGPLAVLRTSQGLRISGNESWLLPGLTVMMPERTHALRRRFLWMIAGGPLANLLVLGLIGSLLLITVTVADKETLLDAVSAQPPFWKWMVLVCLTFTAQMGGLSLVVMIASLWPYRAKKTGLMSDGGRIRMLLRGGADADRWVAISMLINTSMTGRRPREWDAEQIQVATALSDNTTDEWQACLFAYLWALDRGAVDLAGEYLDRLEPLGEKVPFLRPLVAAEVAFFEARHRDNLERALERCASAPPGTNELRLRAEMAIHLREGRWAEATQSGEAALDVLAKSSIPMEAGVNVAKVEWIHSLLLEAERGVASPGAGATPLVQPGGLTRGG